MGALDRTERYVKGFRADCDSAWEAIKEQHDRAMLVLDVEDTIGIGVCALESWFRHAESWHKWVSEDIDRYNESYHRQLRWIESMTGETAKMALELIDTVKSWGFAIKREQDFRELVCKLLNNAETPTRQFKSPEFREYANEAYRAYDSGNTEKIDSWSD